MRSRASPTVRTTQPDPCGAAGALTPCAVVSTGADRSGLRLGHLALALVAVVLTLVWAGAIGGFVGVTCAYVGLIVGTLVNIPAHEGGHLLAALSLRLRVVAVRVLGVYVWRRGGLPPIASRNHVQAQWGEARVLERPLRIVFAGGGPAANAVLTAVAWWFAARSPSVGVRCLLLGAGVTGAWLVFMNLIPVQDGALASDGLTIGRWLFHPTAQRNLENSRRAVIELTRSTNRDVLRTALTDGRPEVAAAAAGRLLTLLAHGPAPDARFILERADTNLERAATSGQTAQTTAALACAVVELWTIVIIREVITPAHPSVAELDVARVGRWAALAQRVAPDADRTGTARAVALMFGDRPLEARAILAAADHTLSGQLLANRCAVRAMVELQVRDVEQARRALAACPAEERNGFLPRVAARMLEGALTARPPEPA